jgi:hypothetical protein
MLTIWTASDKNSDKIIAVASNIIYKGNPKPDQLQHCIRSLENGAIAENLFGIPFGYVKTVTLEKSGTQIEIQFGNDSTEELRMTDETKRLEIFSHLKENIPNTIYTSEKLTAWDSAKKPLYALLFMAIIFGFSISTAWEIEHGSQYELRGSGRSVAAIVLLLANLGVVKLCLLFVTIFTIIGISIAKKSRNRPEIMQIRRV